MKFGKCSSVQLNYSKAEPERVQNKAGTEQMRNVLLHYPFSSALKDTLFTPSCFS